MVGEEKTFVMVHDTEEKGSDVNLASHLLMDAFKDTYDLALVLSQDSDLLEPMRMVTQELGKVVVLAWLDRTEPGKRHKSVATTIRHIQEGMLVRSQFPDPVIGRGGLKIARPVEWDPNRPM